MSKAATIAVMAVLVASGCGDDDTASPSVLDVPGSYETIQSAVDAAEPGDLVLVDAGEYHEAVRVETNDITIRGTDRNDVVLDGEHDLVDGVHVTADGVAIENLTVRNFRQNGVIFNGAGGDREPGDDGVYGTGEGTLTGYRASYVTTVNNGTYGIYAFAATGGLIEHSLTRGSPDSGIYVGQCRPCDVLVTESIAELNAIGYSGTNASGGVYVVDSVFRRNRLGLTPNSQDMELLAPQVETVVAGNLVHDNDDPAAPAIGAGFFGGGIAVGGGTQNLIVRNRVVGHDVYGVGLVHLNEFDPIDNRVAGNVLEGNGVDLYFEVRTGEISRFGNCFEDNSFTTSSPVEIEQALPCGADEAEELTRSQVETADAPPNVDYRAIPLPEDQPTRPGDPSEIPSAPAGFPGSPSIDEIAVPESP